VHRSSTRVWPRTRTGAGVAGTSYKVDAGGTLDRVAVPAGALYRVGFTMPNSVGTTTRVNFGAPGLMIVT